MRGGVHPQQPAPDATASAFAVLPQHAPDAVASTDVPQHGATRPAGSERSRVAEGGFAQHPPVLATLNASAGFLVSLMIGSQRVKRAVLIAV
jgi:hypothetical protein